MRIYSIIICQHPATENTTSILFLASTTDERALYNEDAKMVLNINLYQNLAQKSMVIIIHLYL